MICPLRRSSESVKHGGTDDARVIFIVRKGEGNLAARVGHQDAVKLPAQRLQEGAAFVADAAAQDNNLRAVAVDNVGQADGQIVQVPLDYLLRSRVGLACGRKRRFGCDRTVLVRLQGQAGIRV